MRTDHPIDTCSAAATGQPFTCAVIRYATAGILALLLQACVFVPRTTTKFDEDCHILARHMTMEPVQIAQLSSCTNSQCTEFMVIAGITAAASAVISGSIVIVGNVVYWMEKQGRCLQVK